MARPWSARCYGVARQRDGSRQNGIGWLRRAFSPAFRAGSLYPLARGCRRSWRGEGCNYGLWLRRRRRRFRSQQLAEGAAFTLSAPSRDALENILNSLTEALFPRHYGQFDLDGENIDYFFGNALSIALDSLCEQIHRGALFVGDELLPGFRREDAIELTRAFASRLPEVRGFRPWSVETLV
jgi:hypothetical protein